LFGNVLERLADGAANLGLLGLLDACLLLEGACTSARSGDGTPRVVASSAKSLAATGGSVPRTGGLPATSVALVASCVGLGGLGSVGRGFARTRARPADLPRHLRRTVWGSCLTKSAISRRRTGPESHGVAEAEPPHEVAEFSASELPEEGMSSEPPMRERPSRPKNGSVMELPLRRRTLCTRASNSRLMSCLPTPQNSSGTSWATRSRFCWDELGSRAC